MAKKAKGEKPEKDNIIENAEEISEECGCEVCDSEAVDTVGARLAEFEDKYIRLMAEYDNYKRRTQREKTGIYGDAVADTVKEFLPILDGLERAVASADGDIDAVAVLDGLNMLTGLMTSVLDKIGVKPINAVGEPFDANLHDAVMHIDDDSLGENVVAEEFCKGYAYNDKVVRHSMVKVAN